MTGSLDLKQYIRSIPDFPKPGIMFRDITPLLMHPPALRHAVSLLADEFRDLKINKIMAAEARGFIFATPLAMELDAGFVPVRKHGKLPFDTRAFHYDLEYGSDTLEIHSDALEPGDRVLMIDDLLATGGTVAACLHLAKQAEAEVVGCGFLVELDFLNGRAALEDRKVFSLIHYGDENP
ncbi:MAG: adenine phosphoribosyltransferase [Rubinisphaera brasiliensis]|uniref:Adenine phosphoribosyltransferase n=1 Tax=Rubinisphaera brasiliensis (strain ATCC 49424 / DSM 5305 / JCM 21570 / IAM 15109 / NBRC 103401 / IFAM 1448) TaxID=756272 RepID=F0SMK5_RUBBR|nr:MULTISPECIES: adenine phosphoribosyltransferase [Rubinisphaera]ADY57767.1 adenine phosphoribosyltransferase [Rubinisphaera brasiliensis DSM 5305]MBR9802054.1 adenine phosphoribosyltransferase [bacterium]